MTQDTSQGTAQNGHGVRQVGAIYQGTQSAGHVTIFKNFYSKDVVNANYKSYNFNVDIVASSPDFVEMRIIANLDVDSSNLNRARHVITHEFMGHGGGHDFWNSEQDVEIYTRSKMCEAFTC